MNISGTGTIAHQHLRYNQQHFYPRYAALFGEK
jgi:hypothetical protein